MFNGTTAEFTGVNALGRTYLNGKPLPDETRKEIIRLHLLSRSPTAISRQVKVSHGCVTKIIERYNKCGSLEPLKIGGSKPRVVTEPVIKAVRKYKKENAFIFGWEIRKKLIVDGVCTETNVPSLSSVNRIVRTCFGKKYINDEEDKKNTSTSNSSSDEDPSFNYNKLTEGQREVYDMVLRGKLFNGLK